MSEDIKWKCAGCGKTAPFTCNCATEVAYADGLGSKWKRDVLVQSEKDEMSEYKEMPDLAAMRELLKAAQKEHCRSETLEWLLYVVEAKERMKSLRASHGYDEHGASL